MEAVLLVIHIIFVVSLVLVILIQRTSNDGLSGLGGGASGGAIFSARGQANFFTRATGLLALGFICTSLALAYLASHREGGNSIASSIAADQNREKVVKTFSDEKAQTQKPAVAPATPAAPQVPLAK